LERNKYLYSHSKTNITPFASDYDDFIGAMLAERERGRKRIKRVETDLVKLGVNSSTVRNLIRYYPVGLLEKLISATEKRQPEEPATYFLNGLKRSKIKHRIQHNPTEDEDT